MRKFRRAGFSWEMGSSMAQEQSISGRLDCEYLYFPFCIKLILIELIALTLMERSRSFLPLGRWLGIHQGSAVDDFKRVGRVRIRLVLLKCAEQVWGFELWAWLQRIDGQYAELWGYSFHQLANSYLV
ncbi:hypothetical protein DSO57_1016963 [Entomophthora muscae]|uniref:Uncharacterized protein n=1 Tax=Entomophthora muscae TaxID=34485 RepID=A0ACC2UDM3_9FUNG|nr:hypothetical protein DSO57_1016963 [Entomophthora muscae]